jgi:exodeoxyribonuclease-3
MTSKKSKNFRVYSWNVNGIRAALKKGFTSWLEGCEGDVVGLQETRILPEQLEKAFPIPEGWHGSISAAERPGYSGVGLLSKKPWDHVQTSLGEPSFDEEGRLQLAAFGALWIANVYFPNGSGKERDNSRVPFNLAFYRRLFDKLEKLRAHGGRVLVIGDYNTAHREIDLARPKQNEKTSGFLPEEREELDRWIRSGWTDTFRAFEKGEGHYTWWSQRFGVREKNIGWRIDYVLASEGAMPFVRSAGILPQVRGSDHAPIFVDLDESVLGD